MNRLLCTPITSLVLAALLAAPTAAQVNSAVIEVLVRDSQNRPIEGVLVRAVNPESGAAIEVMTGPDGTGRLPAVPPATYEVRFSRQGFQPVTEPSVVLRVGQTGVIHATMQAQLTEAVTVVGAPRLVDVHKTDSSANIVPEQIANLPL